MSEQEQFLIEVLQKVSTLIGTIEERYRDAAFPIILQTLINSSDISTSKSIPMQSNNQAEITELRLPPNISVNEFFRRAAPDSHPGRVVSAAYYLFHTKKLELLTQADIVEIYGKLREPKPKNLADVINQCIRKAHLIDGPTTEKHKTWTITPDGEKYVEGLLSGNTNSRKSTS